MTVNNNDDAYEYFCKYFRGPVSQKAFEIVCKEILTCMRNVPIPLRVLSQWFLTILCILKGGRFEDFKNHRQHEILNDTVRTAPRGLESFDDAVKWIIKPVIRCKNLEEVQQMTTYRIRGLRCPIKPMTREEKKPRLYKLAESKIEFEGLYAYKPSVLCPAQEPLSGRMWVSTDIGVFGVLTVFADVTLPVRWSDCMSPVYMSDHEVPDYSLGVNLKSWGVETHENLVEVELVFWSGWWMLRLIGARLPARGYRLTTPRPKGNDLPRRGLARWFDNFTMPVMTASSDESLIGLFVRPGQVFEYKDDTGPWTFTVPNV